MTECHDEVALLDKATCRERQPAEVALAIEDPSYHKSWLDAQHAQFNPPTT